MHPFTTEHKRNRRTPRKKLGSKGYSRDFQIRGDKKKFKRKTSTSGGRLVQGEQLFGINAVHSALKYPAARENFYRLFLRDNKRIDSEAKVTTEIKKLIEIRTFAEKHNLPVRYVPKQEMDQIAKNGHHQGVLLDCSPLQVLHCTQDRLAEVLATSGTRPPLVLVFDEIHDPRNFGSALRSATFFDCDLIVFSEKNSTSLTPTVSRTSAGTLEYLASHQLISSISSKSNTPKFLREAKECGYRVLGTAVEDVMSISNDRIEKEETLGHNFVLDEPTVIVFGNEGAGMRTNVKRECDATLHIPGRHQAIDSLNVGVAVGIFLSILSSGDGLIKRTPSSNS